MERLEENIKNEELVYDGTVKQDHKGNAILGILEGPCADFISPTRNDRLYPEELWEKVFANPIVKELFNCGGILGELDHPTDRDETVTEKVAICMPEPPKKNDHGQLIAKFHILDTPNGRIVKTLCDYGYKLGISSRGCGDVTEDFNGNEVVDPNTYDFKAFDIVVLPAVKSARLKVVESLDQSKTFKQALCESLKKANADERRVMTETLDHLKIDYTEVTDPDTVDNVKVEMVKELQEAVKAKRQLEIENRQLQEKLSVCYAKETKLNEQLKKYETVVVDLSTNARKVKPLTNKIEVLENLIKEKESTINNQATRIQKLVESKRVDSEDKQKLTESFNKNTTLIENISSENKKLQEQLRIQKEEFIEEQTALKESIEEMRKDSMLKANEYQEKANKAKALVEKYKNVAKAATNAYIETKAKTLGVSSQEIKNKLNENFTFNDIEKVCDDIRNYQLNISRLPFDLSRAKVSITESKEPIQSNKKNTFIDDDVDSDLIALAKKYY